MLAISMKTFGRPAEAMPIMWVGLLLSMMSLSTQFQQLVMGPGQHLAFQRPISSIVPRMTKHP